jgi:hypothetical protein
MYTRLSSLSCVPKKKKSNERQVSPQPCQTSVSHLFLSILHIDIVDIFLSFPLLQHTLRTLVHALVHESEEAHRASANAHAVDEAGSEERAEDGAEVGVGDL